ncbi:MAG: hypothetical protein ACREJD_12715 [Phycisphaerales bacterium]
MNGCGRGVCSDGGTFGRLEYVGADEVDNCCGGGTDPGERGGLGGDGGLGTLDMG